MNPSVKTYLLHLPRFLLVLLWCALSAGALSATLANVFAGYDAAARLWQTIGGAIACLLIFFYTVRALVVREPLYAELYRQGTLPFGKHLSSALRSPAVWCDLLLTVASLLVFARSNPLHLPIHALAALTQPPEEQFFLYVTCISLPLYTVLFFLAHVRAKGKMQALYAQRQSKPRRKKSLPAPLAYIIACIEPSLILAVLCAILPLIFNVIMLLVKALGEIAVWIAIGALTLYLLIFRYTRAMLKRGKFRRELCRLARSLGEEILFHRSPVASLFLSSDKADFTLWHKGRRYDGKFIHSLRTYTPMLFDGSGSVALHRIYRIRRVELFRTVSMQDYTFDSEGERVVIILPTPKKLCYVGQGMSREVDVGDRIGGYSFYNATGFLRAIERDCLDRGEVLMR